jgi:tetratricopeptide (TPR) repeat protein
MNINRRTSFAIGIVFAALAAMVLLPTLGTAQSNQLMLADILIALRSKKVPLNERNDIISKAVAARGITFSLTPEIEKELSDTGAAKELIDAIRQKNQIVKVAAAVPQPEVKPVPPPPDFAFYQKRGDAGLAAADYDAAIADYSKAIEMNPAWIGSYLGRAEARSQKRAWADAILDYDKVIELKPDNAVAYFKRAEALEQKGEIDLALAGYDKAFSLDPSNVAAKSASARISAEKQKVAKAAEPAVAAPAAKIPEFLQLGALSKEQAVTMAMPNFPPSISRANITGQVTVEVTIDLEGKVIAAKAVSGIAFLRANSEMAAMRSKFKPQTFNGVPVKAKGSITYNFTNGRE